jgi:hypothetical protein
VRAYDLVLTVIPAEQLLFESDRYFNEALDLCSAIPAEEQFNRLHVLTTYAAHLAKRDPERANELSEEALLLLGNGADGRGAWGEWLELMADQEYDHRKATALYRVGFTNAPGWAQLWVKAIGSAALANRHDEVPDVCQRIQKEQTPDLVSKSATAYRQHREELAPYIRERWERGLQVIEELCTPVPAREPENDDR